MGTRTVNGFRIRLDRVCVALGRIFAIRSPSRKIQVLNLVMIEKSDLRKMSGSPPALCASPLLLYIPLQTLSLSMFTIASLNLSKHGSSAEKRSYGQRVDCFYSKAFTLVLSLIQFSGFQIHLICSHFLVKSDTKVLHFGNSYLD